MKRKERGEAGLVTLQDGMQSLTSAFGKGLGGSLKDSGWRGGLRVSPKFPFAWGCLQFICRGRGT